MSTVERVRVRDDGFCAGPACKNVRPEAAVKAGDPFCSRQCAVDGLREVAAVGELAGSGSAAADLTPLLGEPERAATSPSTVTLGRGERAILNVLASGPKRLPEIEAARGVSYGTIKTQTTVLVAKGLVYRVSRGLYALTDSGREPRGDGVDPAVIPRAAQPPAERDIKVSTPAGPSAAAPARYGGRTPSRPDVVVAVRDPIRTADIPYDADILESEATFLRNRAAALEQIAGGIRKLAELAA